ncbi:M28 family metallopeptidase [Hymenobacter perfusus]|uniref:M28 family peptidase n=1 Tax=Hymenobacter perfusus TaxID=1236770 RepID=A0A3R9P0V7_9BACT|nr:M28 family peptidase [Hymenobacter perfusus]RSK46204.1 M28 family peptidase [Hymenobacter perfusus]
MIRRHLLLSLTVGGLGWGMLMPASLQAQNMPRVRQTIATLASPAFHGRGYVSGGEQKAAQYLQRRFRQSGLQPLSPDFCQPFTLPINTFPGRAALQADGKALRPGFDFIAEAASGSGNLHGSVYELDTLIFSQSAAQTTFLATDLRQTVLVLRQRDNHKLSALPEPVQSHLATAASRITLVPKLTATLAGQQLPQPRLEVLATVWPQHVQSVQLQLDARLQPAYQTQNIIGYLPGLAQPDSFVVVTAHYDHLGQLGKHTYFPGANDNASGTAMLLELAAHYARPENRLAYSVVFISFGAEEAGLLGSKYFTEHPLVPLDRIRFLLNLDLLGTGNEGATVVNGRVFARQFQQLQNLNTANHYLPSLAARGKGANSDHYYFSERGVPAFFLYTRGGIAAYHDIQDRAATLPLTAFTNTFCLLRDFLNMQGSSAR